MPRGTPFSSTRRCRPVPFFPPVCWVSADTILADRGLDLGAVNGLPAPFYPVLLIVNRNAARPQRLEEVRFAPFLKIAVYRTAGPKCLRQRLPLYPGAQHKHDPREYLPWLQRLAATPGFPLVLLLAASLAFRNQWSGYGLQLIRHFPRLRPLPGFWHVPSGPCLLHRSWLKYYLRIGS